MKAGGTSCPIRWQCPGIGESATVGSPAAVVNSVIDALAPFGVKHADMPLTPATVWCAIQAASR